MGKMEVLETQNYDKFKFIKDNRKVNKLHLRKLRDSIAKQFLFSPIVVNEKLEIIDGQHRFTVCKEMGLPILYNIVKGYGFRETKTYNISNRNWSIEDFLNAYITQKNINYVRYAQLRKKFPFEHSILLHQINKARTQSAFREFKEGNLKLTLDAIGNISKDLEKIYDFRKHFEFWNQRSFLLAVLRLFKNSKYDHKRMIGKLEEVPKKVVFSSQMIDYLRQLENIYNYKMTKSKVVRFF
jgi:hypothetical protein